MQKERDADCSPYERLRAENQALRALIQDILDYLDNSPERSLERDSVLYHALKAAITPPIR